MVPQRGFSLVLILLIVAIFAGGIFLGFSFSKHTQPVSNQQDVKKENETDSQIPVLGPISVKESSGDIFVLKNGKEKQITSWGYNFDPVLSPDKTKVVFSSQTKESVEEQKLRQDPDRGGYFLPSENIWVINLDGTNAYALTTHERWINREVIKWVDNEQILVREGEDTVKLYDISTKTTKTLIGHEDPHSFCLDACGYNVSFYDSPDKKYLVKIYSGGGVEGSSEIDSKIEILNLETLKKVEKVNPYQTNVGDVSFDLENKTISFVGSKDYYDEKKHKVTLNLDNGDIQIN